MSFPIAELALLRQELLEGVPIEQCTDARQNLQEIEDLTQKREKECIEAQKMIDELGHEIGRLRNGVKKVMEREGNQKQP